MERDNFKVKMDTFIPYWEGPVMVEGTHGGKGYLEVTM